MRIRFVAAVVMPLSLAFSGQEWTSGKGPEGLPKRVVSEVANVQPGEVVVIMGGKHTFPLMEDLAIEVLRAGGMPETVVNSERVTRFWMLEVPEKYLEQEPLYYVEWMKHVDVVISLPDAKDSKAVYGNIPEHRMAKFLQVWQALRKRMEPASTAWVAIGYPTADDAASLGLDFAVYEKMHWEAVNADYAAISEKAHRLKAQLQSAKLVRVRSPAGTDVTFSVRGRPIITNPGTTAREKGVARPMVERTVRLPGGSVLTAPLENSAIGRVVVPRHRYNYEPLTEVSFEFKNGRVENFEAALGGEAFRRMLAAYRGAAEVIGGFSIGLNPALKVIEEGADYRPSGAAGLVWINIGDNLALGGTNNAQGHWIAFPIVKASVELDGMTIVRDGELVF